jgi:hypothetical protein
MNEITNPTNIQITKNTKTFIKYDGILNLNIKLIYKNITILMMAINGIIIIIFFNFIFFILFHINTNIINIF